LGAVAHARWRIAAAIRFLCLQTAGGPHPRAWLSRHALMRPAMPMVRARSRFALGDRGSAMIRLTTPC
jgi:hypothetical protein